MGSLVETVKDAVRRRLVVDDCVALIEAEVEEKRGLKGRAIKLAYRTVKGLKPGMIGMAMDGLLDDFAARLDPFWQECQATGAEPRDFFVRRKAEVADALLGITDDRARKSPHKVLVSAYTRLRPQAAEHIGVAMPRVAQLLVKHAS